MEKPVARLEIVQVLRAAAAIFVVVSHASHELARMLVSADSGFNEKLFPGDFGVDLFFMISGFIMVYTNWDHFGLPGAMRTFLTRRLIRIIPLYWLMTTVMIAVVILVPDQVRTATDDAGQWLASYFFLPYAREGDGMIRPVLGLGWSLQYEMAFYLVFAAALLMPRRIGILAVLTAIPATVLLAGLSGGEAAIIRFLAHPILLEFCGGMIIGLFCVNGVRLAVPAGILAGMAGVLLLAFSPQFSDQVDRIRHVEYGGPAFLILSATVLTRGAEWAKMPALAVRAGESSYSLYLLHPFVVGALAILFKSAGSGATASPAHLETVYFLAVLAGSLGLADRLHAWFDAPVTGWLRRRLDGTRPGMPAGKPVEPASGAVS